MVSAQGSNPQPRKYRRAQRWVPSPTWPSPDRLDSFTTPASLSTIVPISTAPNCSHLLSLPLRVVIFAYNLAASPCTHTTPSINSDCPSISCAPTTPQTARLHYFPEHRPHPIKMTLRFFFAHISPCQGQLPMNCSLRAWRCPDQHRHSVQCSMGRSK